MGRGIDATQVIVAFIGFCGVLATVLAAVVGAQLKVHADNRKDHGETATKVDQLLEHQSVIQRDVQYIRADVTDIHGAINELRRTDHDAESRITHLERFHTGDDAA